MPIEPIDDDLAPRCFAGSSVWRSMPCPAPTVFIHDRDRLLETAMARAFLPGLPTLEPVERLPSSRHVSVDGTTIGAWASIKSSRCKHIVGTGIAAGSGRTRIKIFAPNAKNGADLKPKQIDLIFIERLSMTPS